MQCMSLLFAIICYLETIISTLIELKETVDLTWQFNNDTIYWSHTYPFTFTKKIAEVRTDGVWRESNEFCAGEHGGTHFDAPSHFYKKGWKVGEIPLTHLIVRGIMIDLTDEVQKLHDQARLLPIHLEKWKSKHGNIPKNCVILVRFGWSKYYMDKFLYLGLDNQHHLNFPGISSAAADWIVQSGDVVGVGVDTAGIDPGRDPNFPAHKILNANQIYVLENIKIPSVFPENDFILYVMPMKVEQGNGAPLRIVAVPSKLGIIPPNLAVPTTPLYSHVLVIISSTILYVLCVLPILME